LAVTGEGGMICTNDDELYKKHLEYGIKEEFLEHFGLMN